MLIRRPPPGWTTLPNGLAVPGMSFANPLGRFGVCGSGKCCKCTDCEPYGVPGTVTWFTHSVSSGVITRVNHEGPCVTYWVDSVSGGGAESGSGTEADPWTNLNTVFSDDCIYEICTTQGCPKVKVLVKGTIDYAVEGNAGRNYGRQLVIEPWGEGRIAITVSGSGTVYAVKDCIGCIFKLIDASGTSNYTQTSAGFYSCSSSTFDNCTGTGIDTVGYTYGFSRFGFCNCSSSTFDNCTGTGTGDGYDNSDVGFYNCDSSTFNDCDGIGTVTSTGVSTSAYGFHSCSSSTFDNCTGTGTSVSAGVGAGFYSCSSSTFDNCTGTGTSVSPGVSAGFYSCSFSTFDNCTGTGTSVSAGVSAGFHSCSSSTFNDCDGEGYLTGTTGCRRACGFYSNSGSSFSGCSTTDRICTGCAAGVCDAFTCDI